MYQNARQKSRNSENARKNSCMLENSLGNFKKKILKEEISFKEA